MHTAAYTMFITLEIYSSFLAVKGCDSPCTPQAPTALTQMTVVVQTGIDGETDGPSPGQDPPESYV